MDGKENETGLGGFGNKEGGQLGWVWAAMTD